MRFDVFMDRWVGLGQQLGEMNPAAAPAIVLIIAAGSAVP